MRFTMTVVAGLSAALAAGCAHHRNQPTGPFAERLTAAKAIQDSQERDQALSQIALDASQIPDVNGVRQALEGISATTARDEASGGSAVRLKQAGQTRYAYDIAKHIQDTQKRDDTLKLLSER